MRRIVESEILHNEAQAFMALENLKIRKDVATGLTSTSQSVARSSEPVANMASTSAVSMGAMAGSGKAIARELHGIYIMGASLVDRIDYYGKWMQISSTDQLFHIRPKHKGTALVIFNLHLRL
ncbi:hypothetical protein F4782DRAFT_514819 [Xylaria castorea]|nr:hypothetical protein F4782DRAFT_514819 [Xylaria castorea]